MPRKIVDTNSRVSLRIPPEDKALLVRAMTLEQTTLTDFVLKHSVQAARSVVAQVERVQLSQRDSQHVLNLLENPPAPNSKLMQAAHDLPKDP